MCLYKSINGFKLSSILKNNNNNNSFYIFIEIFSSKILKMFQNPYPSSFVVPNPVRIINKNHKKKNIFFNFLLN